ncbi:MAG: L,D-transpeptidase [Saprospiraceae bacterium]|nr:L,D-transpeptidase [Saprospiraceae bacterium]
MFLRLVAQVFVLILLNMPLAVSQIVKDEAIMIRVEKDVKIQDYFEHVKELTDVYLSSFPDEIREHLLVHSNPWILERLVRTDYYIRAEEGKFIADQKNMVILEKGDEIQLPDSGSLNRIQQELATLAIDINIPEYKLRIFRDRLLLWEFPVRVGRNSKAYLAAIDRNADLRTLTGEGQIVKIFKDPPFINPVTNKRYHETMRDDGKVTAMPLIPWLETEINGRRNGQLIHPTTNPITLGKAYSNGCIGTGEKEAWIIYYHAPVGTLVRIRYDLNVKNVEGDSIRLPDIYQRSNPRSREDLDHIQL